MDIAQYYEHQSVEAYYRRIWAERDIFSARPDDTRPSYTLLLPPPNITGVLHLGHVLNTTVQDILARYARMQGKNVCWIPGSDHASIATEAKVWASLSAEGKHKYNYDRASFLEKVWAWRDKYGTIIYEQLQRLGLSLDWQRQTFTMDTDYEQAVIQVFVDLFHKGFIYRGAQMVHWDVKAQTVISDEEIVHKEVAQDLYYLRYYLEDSAAEYVTIATVRPETILADVALCAHPDDARYRKWYGKRFRIPLLDKTIPLIFDTYVDKEFGTGLLKITPAHDMNDYQIAGRHHLEMVRILDDRGRIMADAPLLQGEDRFAARTKILALLEAQGYVVKKEVHTSSVGYSQRTDVVVEPMLKTQWFVRMKALAALALQPVADKEIRIYPETKVINTYKYWLENVKDWCISRQLWWGQRIPVYYDGTGDYVVAESCEKAQRLFREKNKEVALSALKQDEDCLDTWFSSWLWPLQTLKYFSEPDNTDFRYFYPTSVLVTGQDILFFWVARMVMAAKIYTEKIPFERVYFTGMVRDKLGRKMSKSLGNSPDILDLMARYGADALRFSVMIAAPAGNDLLFEEKSLEQARHFNNKLWNVLKLMRLWEKNLSEEMPSDAQIFAVSWMRHKWYSFSEILSQKYEQFQLSSLLKTLYSLIWDDFCSVYLEWIKPHKAAMNATTLRDTKALLEQLLGALHPFMPFITEEIYKHLGGKQMLSEQKWAFLSEKADHTLLRQGEHIRQLMATVRDLRKQHQIPNKQPLQLGVPLSSEGLYEVLAPLLAQQLHVILVPAETVQGAEALSFNVASKTFWIRLPQIAAAEKIKQEEKLASELKRLQVFLQKINQKLDNPKFLQGASDSVIQAERKKQSDIMEKISAIQSLLK